MILLSSPDHHSMLHHRDYAIRLPAHSLHRGPHIHVCNFSQSPSSLRVPVLFFFWTSLLSVSVPTAMAMSASASALVSSAAPTLVHTHSRICASVDAPFSRAAVDTAVSHVSISQASRHARVSWTAMSASMNAAVDTAMLARSPGSSRRPDIEFLASVVPRTCTTLTG